MLRLREQVKLLLKPHCGWYAAVAAVGLTWLGMAAIHTAEPMYAAIQGKWLVVALIVMVYCLIPHPRLVGLASYPLMAISLVLLIYVITPGAPLVPRINGATCWIRLFKFSFQPSELSKIGFVLALAWYLRYRHSYRTLRGLLVPFVIMFVPVALILKEPDLGTALLFAPTLFVMLVAAGAKLRHLGALVGVALLVIVLNIALIYWVPPSKHPFLRPHQVTRITSMIDSSDIHGDAFQRRTAMNLVGAGWVYGNGQERAATLVKYNRLPHDHNDMIFAVLVNRWGLVGGLATLGLYLLLVLSFVLVAARNKDPFARLATVGFAGMLFSQAMINIGMTAGLLPITGITLPFVSYGGSSLVTTFAMVGLVMNFASRRPAPLSRPSFEYDPADLIFQ